MVNIHGMEISLTYFEGVWTATFRGNVSEAFSADEAVLQVMEAFFREVAPDLYG